MLGGLGYICVPAQRCPFTTHWAQQLLLHLSVCCDPGGNTQTERRLSEPVHQVTAAPVSSHFLRDVAETRGSESPHGNTCMDENNNRLLQCLTTVFDSK